MGSTRKEVRRLVTETEAQGWKTDDRGDKVILRSPDGVGQVTVHWTPSDHRWKKNLLSDLKRAGFEPPAEGKGKKKGKSK